MCDRRLADIPEGLLDRRKPLDELELGLEYDVYGWFNFESDPDGVKGLDRKFISVEALTKLPEFSAKAGGFEVAVKALREASAVPARARWET